MTNGNGHNGHSNGHKAKPLEVSEVYLITLQGRPVTVHVCPPGIAANASLCLPGQSQPGLWGRRVRGNRRSRRTDETINMEEVFS